jgi:uncharacterized repeat protein (TIGR01451 family)
MQGSNGLFGRVLLALALLPLALYAQSFHSEWGFDLYSPLTYLDSDVVATPSVSSSATTACTGSPVTLTYSAISDWNTASLQGGTENGATLVTQLSSAPTPTYNYDIRWVNASQSNSLYYAQSPSSAEPRKFKWASATGDEWTPFLAGIGISSYPEYSVGVKYKAPNPPGGWFNGGANYLAYSALFCHAKAQIQVSNGGPSFSPDFNGSSFTTSPIYLSQGSHTVASQLAVQRCMPTIKNTGTYSTKTVRILISDSFTPSFTGNTFTVTIKNPFSCNAVVFSAPVFTPSGTVAPGTQLSFSFTVTNPSTNGEDARVNSVATSSWSPQPTPQPQPYNVNVPLVVPKNGVPVTVSGKLDAPTVPGSYTFNLVVNYGSAVADCTGSPISCPPKVFPISFTVSPPTNPVSCTLLLQGGHGTTFTAPDSANVAATCRASDNTAVPCGALSWSTTATAGTVNPAATNTPPDPSQTLISFTAVNAFQNNALVKAQQGSNFTCNLSFNVAGPDYTSTLTSPSNYAQYQAGASFNATVQTKNIGAATATSTTTRSIFNNGAPQNFNVPGLGQQQSVSSNASFTCPPVAGLYKLNSTADATFLLTESNENNNYDEIWINCTNAAPALRPDYISIISAPSSVLVGTAFAINVTTRNIGPAPAAIFSKTRLLISGYGSSSIFLYNIPPLAANGGSAINATSVNCPPTPGDLVLNSSADYFSQINESNELNNNDTFTVHCSLPGNQPNYVPNITAPSIAFIGIPFSASFATKNIGTADATSLSTTRATFQSTVKDFIVSPPLVVNAQQVDSWAFTCSGNGTQSLVERVDHFSNISESNENDNTQTWPIACYTAPDRCSLAFVNHNATFFSPDSALVRATCFAGAAQTACPPFLWQQTAAGGSMNPTNTNISLLPNSTLSLSGILPTQLGRKVSATSTNALDVYCELPFSVSDGSPIGPDYIVPSVIPDHPTTGIGQTVHFTVTVTNRGNVNATNDSTSTAAYSPGCEIVTDSYFLPHIDALASHISSNVLACTCRTSGLQNITVSANPTHAQWETDFNNNAGVSTFICQAPFQAITCSYFV